MGGAESKSAVTTNVSQVIDNQVDLKMIKETTNKNIMNTMTVNSASCSAAAAAKQTMKTKVGNISGLKKGKIGGGDQEQKVSLQLSCIDTSKIENNIANDIANAFASQLETKFDNNAMAKLEANAKTQAEGGMLPLGSTSTDSNVTTNYNLNVSNKISKTMKDMITNETQKNFSVKTLKERLAQLQAEQVLETEVGNITDSEDLEIGGGKQKQTADLIMKAISEDQTINKTIDKITNQLNSISVDGVTSKAISDVSATATSEAKQKGFDSIVDSITGMIGGIFKGWMGLMMVGLVVIAIIVGIFFFTGGQETLQQGMTLAASKMGGGAKVLSKNDMEIVSAFKSLKLNEIFV
jgi:hypothetical protein